MVHLVNLPAPPPRRVHIASEDALLAGFGMALWVGGGIAMFVWWGPLGLCETVLCFFKLKTIFCMVISLFMFSSYSHIIFYMCVCLENHPFYGDCQGCQGRIVYSFPTRFCPHSTWDHTRFLLSALLHFCFLYFYSVRPTRSVLSYWSF